MSGGTRGTAALLRRAIGVGHDPMVRRTDRIEGMLSFGLVVCAILLVPIAFWAGSAVGAGQRALMAEQELHVHPVVATTTSDSVATPTGTAEYTNPFPESATAEWIWNGDTHTGEVAVDAVTASGTQVDIYVDDQGARTFAPITSGAARSAAVITAVFTWFATMSLLVIGFLLVRVWLDRCRAAQWDRDLRVFLSSEQA